MGKFLIRHEASDKVSFLLPSFVGIGHLCASNYVEEQLLLCLAAGQLRFAVTRLLEKLKHGSKALLCSLRQ